MTMKAARFFGPNDMRVVEVPVPSPGPYDILCKVVRAGICGTDMAIYSGETSFLEQGLVRFPMTPGHEWSGAVAEIGSAVTDFKIGDRVISDTCVACGQCYSCLVGEYYDCKKVQSVGTIRAWDGAYADYILMPQRHLFHLPENVGFDQGAMVEPAATALYAVKRAEVAIGDSVLVHGTGPIGILAAKLAKLSGAAKVLITGRKPFKLEMACRMGADVAINTTEEDLPEVVRREIGSDGVDRVVEASGALDLLRQSIGLTRPGGTISSVAFYERLGDKIDIDKLVLGGITFRGVVGSLGMNRPILNLLASGLLDPVPLITDRYAFNEVHDAMRAMREKNDRRIKIMMEMDRP